MIELNDDEKQIIASMLSLLKDYCEETQCRFCPFHADDEECQFVMKDGIIPNGLTKILERLEEE